MSRVASSAWRWRNVVGPSMSGIITSSSTASGRWLAGQLEGGRAAVGGDDLPAGDHLERQLGDLADRVVVVHHQDVGHRHGSPPSGAGGPRLGGGRSQPAPPDGSVREVGSGPWKVLA